MISKLLIGLDHNHKNKNRDRGLMVIAVVDKKVKNFIKIMEIKRRNQIKII